MPGRAEADAWDVGAVDGVPGWAPPSTIGKAAVPNGAAASAASQRSASAGIRLGTGRPASAAQGRHSKGGGRAEGRGNGCGGIGAGAARRFVISPEPMITRRRCLRHSGGRLLVGGSSAALEFSVHGCFPDGGGSNALLIRSCSTAGAVEQLRRMRARSGRRGGGFTRRKARSGDGIPEQRSGNGVEGVVGVLSFGDGRLRSLWP